MTKRSRLCTPDLVACWCTDGKDRFIGDENILIGENIVQNSMSSINDSMALFLEQQTCATICCTNENGTPYCFSCYYVFNQERGLLYFKSSAEVLHSVLLKNNPAIAGTVLPDKFNKLVTRGIQLQGEVLQQSHPMAKDAYLRYHKKYPMALAIKGEVSSIRIDSIKMTNSKLGFGKKLSWNRQKNLVEVIIS